MPTDFEQTEPVSTFIPVPSEPSELSDNERPIYDEIVIEQPSIGHVFTTYGLLAILGYLVICERSAVIPIAWESLVIPPFPHCMHPIDVENFC
jgi:hypothetical protein